MVLSNSRYRFFINIFILSALMLLFTMFSGTSICRGANPFALIPEESWIFESIDYLAEQDLVDNERWSFLRTRAISRYEVASLLLPLYEKGSSLNLTDGSLFVEKRYDPYTSDILTKLRDEFAVEIGILAGYSPSLVLDGNNQGKAFVNSENGQIPETGNIQLVQKDKRISLHDIIGKNPLLGGGGKEEAASYSTVNLIHDVNSQTVSWNMPIFGLIQIAGNIYGYSNDDNEKVPDSKDPNDKQFNIPQFTLGYDLKAETFGDDVKIILEYGEKFLTSNPLSIAEVIDAKANARMVIFGSEFAAAYGLHKNLSFSVSSKELEMNISMIPEKAVLNAGYGVIDTEGKVDLLGSNIYLLSSEGFHETSFYRFAMLNNGSILEIAANQRRDDYLSLQSTIASAGLEYRITNGLSFVLSIQRVVNAEDNVVFTKGMGLGYNLSSNLTLSLDYRMIDFGFEEDPEDRESSKSATAELTIRF